MRRSTRTLCATAALLAVGGLTAAAPAGAQMDWDEAYDSDTSPESAEAADDSGASKMDADAWYEATVPIEPIAPIESPQPPAPQRAASIEEIVVTARRQEESLQDVPVAISVMTADDLRRERIDNAQDLQGRVPSLVIGPAGQQRNTETPTIRGQGATYGAAPGVVIYFAEVPLPMDSVSNNQGGPGKFFDLGNMQVLKGSQGTLFGRNTTGGALLLEPHKPVDRFEGWLQAEGSELSGRGYEGVINVPLADDRLLIRAGAKAFTRDGFTHDVVTGKDYDNRDYWTARLGITWRIGDSVENYLLGYYAHNDDNGTGNVVGAINSEGFNRAIMTIFGLPVLPVVPPQLQPGCLYFNVNSGSMNCGQDIVDAQRERGNRHVALSADPNDVLKTGGVTDIFSWNITDNLTLRNVASYSFLKHQFRWDLEGSSAQINDINNADGQNQSDTETYTEELQLQGTALNGHLSYVIGAYYDRTSPRGPQSQTAISIFTPVTTDYYTKRHSYAPYAQGTLDLAAVSERLDGLKLTVGGRYTFDRARSFSSFNGQTAEIRDSAPTYTIGLDYPLGSSLVYGKYSRGYKTGGFGMLAVNPANYYFDPEFVSNYELGMKSDLDLGGMPARFNVAVYFTDYDDLQKTAGDSYTAPDVPPGTIPDFGGATYNVGKATVAGVELDGTLRLTDRLQFSANYSYTKADYKEFQLLVGTVTPQRDCSGQEIERGNYADYACTPFQFVAEHQFSVNLRYRLPLDERWGDASLSATYSWMDDQYTAPTAVPEAEPGAWLDAFGLLNVSADWSRIFGSPFDVQLYVSNALDEEYRIANSNVWNVLYAQSSIYGEPRIFGAVLRYRWGQ